LAGWGLFMVLSAQTHMSTTSKLIPTCQQTFNISISVSCEAVRAELLAKFSKPTFYIL